MSEKYKVGESERPHFITINVIDRVDLFTRPVGGEALWGEDRGDWGREGVRKVLVVWPDMRRSVLM